MLSSFVRAFQAGAAFDQINFELARCRPHEKPRSEIDDSMILRDYDERSASVVSDLKKCFALAQIYDAALRTEFGIYGRIGVEIDRGPIRQGDGRMTADGRRETFPVRLTDIEENSRNRRN